MADKFFFKKSCVCTSVWCMQVCTQVCMQVCTQVCTQVCMQVHVPAFLRRVECPLSLSANSFEVWSLSEPGAHLFLGGRDAGKP